MPCVQAIVNLRPVTASGHVLAKSYDYVIVGAGSAGCVVARRLLDGTDATVLLLEAGGSGDGVASLSNPPQWVENLGSPYDWAYHYEPSPHVAHRAKPLGIETLVDLPGVGRNLQDHVWIPGLCFEAKHPLPAPN